MRKTPMEMLEEFHAKFEVMKIDSSLSELERIELLYLRVRLIMEETKEVDDAVFNLVDAPDFDKAVRAKADLLKELADLIYVTYGFAELLDLPIDTALAEVHANNLTKLGPDGKPIRRADGKILKPADYQPCNLNHLIHTSED
jgi:predicted HAD superfamily Cof-like phosphohydrolase